MNGKRTKRTSENEKLFQLEFLFFVQVVNIEKKYNESGCG